MALVPGMIMRCAVFAELAFVNVEFASGQFWVLVVVDFVMLVMRDVRAC